MPASGSILPEFSLDELEQARAKSASQVNNYGSLNEPFYADPRKTLVHFDDERSEQSLTLLLQLGYLSEQPDDNQSWNQASLDIAWNDWKHEFAEATDPLLNAISLSIDTGEETGEYENLLRRNLKACTTLEGEVTLLRWPKTGETSLVSRIVLSRLRLFGMFDLPADSPFPSGLTGQIRNRARWIAEGNHWTALEILNRLSDIKALSQSVSTKIGQRYALLRGIEGISLPEQARQFKVKRTTKKGGGNADKRFKKTNSVTFLNLENPSGRNWNELAVKILQIRLWMLGYYEGEIDSDWGHLSSAAYERFVDQYDFKKKKEFKIVKAKNGMLALRIGKVFETIIRDIDEMAESLERSEIDAALESESQQEDSAMWKVMENAYTEDRNSKGDRSDRSPLVRRSGDLITLDHSPNLKRRRYHGWRGIFSAFGRFFRKVKNKAISFAKGLIKALKKGLGYAMNIVRYVVGATRMAARITKLAIMRLQAWLLGRPVGSGAFPKIIMTQYQMDFDTVCVIDRNCPPETIDQHSRLLDWMKISFEVMVTIATKVTGIVLALGNWLLMAWRVLKLIREVMSILKENPLEGLFSESVAI